MTHTTVDLADIEVGYCPGCSKDAYWTADDAGAAATAYVARYGGVYRPYPCPRGTGLHLSTKPMNAPLQAPKTKGRP